MRKQKELHHEEEESWFGQECVDMEGYRSITRHREQGCLQEVRRVRCTTENIGGADLRTDDCGLSDLIVRLIIWGAWASGQ